MKKQPIFLTGSVLALSVVVALVLVNSGVFTARASEPLEKKISQGTIAVKAIHQNSKEVQNFWTKKMMRKAQPIERLFAPEVGSKARGQKAGSIQLMANSAVPIESYSQKPYAVSGKLFFKYGTGTYVCSATAVISQNESTVDTAGHCIIQRSSRTGYYSDWMFCPQYIDGDCPKGKWTASQVAVSKGWSERGSSSYDLGAIVVNKNNGQTLTDTVGGVELAVNLPREREMTALGYPQLSPFDGKRMQSCSGKTTQNYEGNSLIIGIPCNMTAGSSGGGWFRFVDGAWKLNGHNSLTNTAYPSMMFSAYFGDEALAVFNSVQSVLPGESVTPTPVVTATVKQAR